MPGPAKRQESKRNDPSWVSSTHYMRSSRKVALQRYLDVSKLDNSADHQHPADLSELVDQALEAWLYVQLPLLERRVFGQQQEAGT